MARIMFASALALGAVLTSSGFTTAAEPTAGFTMTLGGRGTAAEAATAIEDTELTGGRGFHGGFHGGGWGWGGGSRVGWGGGWGWNRWNTGWGWNRWNAGWGWNRWNTGWGWNRWNAGWGWNRWNTGWGWGWGARPVFVNSFSPVGGWDPCWNSGWGVNSGLSGGFIRIGGTADDAYAPAVTLNNANAQVADASGSADTFRYDGGPAHPIPRPTPDATTMAQPVPPSVGLPVSLKKEVKPASPYKYKAYGEK